ncbi:hypothetical protein GAU_0216 [Gemmatimonas aurantiaca T-27]|uniref:Uncharacterized protein n=2 Tax=Gemmatimonas aurantiaca TaxID=173480 RepID=C1A4U8_GEMAT|nr:hypothetical protein GAU_0216 [Gemmatimonas aurantiaca T-27]
MSEGSDARMLSDAEQVAALIDGRLSVEARKALIARLSGDPEWRDVLVTAAELVDRTSESTVAPSAVSGAFPVYGEEVVAQGAKVLPFAPRIQRWRWTMAAAAVMVGVAGLSYWTHSQMSIATRPALTLAMVEPPAMVVAEGRSVSPALARWTRVRAATRELPPRALAVRLGALSSVALQAARAGDDAGLRVHREDMRALLGQLPGSSPFASALDSTHNVQALFELFQSVRALVDGRAFDAGAMLALAHVRIDIASDRLITLLAADSAADPEVARLLVRLHEEGAINAPTPSASTVSTLDSLLVRLAR